MRGQGSFETMAVLGVGLVIMSLIVFFTSTHYTAAQGITQTEGGRAALRDLATAGAEVHSSGAGAQTVAEITLPRGVKNITVERRSLDLHFESGKVMHWSVPYDASGTITASFGRNYIPVRSADGGACFGEGCP